LGEGRDALRRRADLANDLQHAILLLEPENPMRRVVAANVNAIKRRVLVTAINVAAGDRVPILATIREHRRRVGGGLFATAIPERLESFINVPTEILAAPNGINFFHPILPHIA